MAEIKIDMLEVSPSTPCHVSKLEAMLCTRKVKLMVRESGTDPMVLMYCDMNVPGAKIKDTMGNLCAAVARLNGLDPPNTMAIMVMPDRAKESNKRGLSDEEAPIEKDLQNLSGLLRAWSVMGSI